MVIKIIKKGISNNKKYVVLEYPGKTKVNTIMKKYGKNYHPGIVGSTKKEDGKYHQVLWKRKIPLKSIREIKSYYNW